MFNTNSWKTILFSLLFLTGLHSFAGKRYWIGNGSNKNWNTTANWSTASGGTSGASVPGTNDTAYFNSNGNGQLILDANVSIKMLLMESTYADTIKQNGKTIAANTATFNGGTFLGNTGNITINASFTLAGATFICTASILTIGGNLSFTGGTFTHNNGTVKLTGTSTITGNINFYDLQLTPAAAATYTFDAASTFNVSHLLSQSGTNQIKINGGTINVQGNLTHSGSYPIVAATGTININGTSNQTLSGVSAVSTGGYCAIKINKSNGVLTVSNIINVYGTWERVSGAVNDTSNDAEISFPLGSTSTIKGTQKFNKLYIGTSGGSSTFTVNTGDTLTVKDVYTGGTGSITYNGYLNITRNCYLENTGTSGGGSGTISFTGQGSQLFSGQTLGINQGTLPNVRIDKESGTLTLKNVINIKGNWTHTRGTLEPVTENSTVCFTGGSRTIAGKSNFNNIILNANAASTFTIPSTDTITVLGELKIDGVNSAVINTGTINAKGNVTVTNTSSGVTSTSGLIRICGDGNQTLTGSGIAATGRLCHITIDKAQGTLYLSSLITVLGDWKYVKGTVDPGTSTVIAYILQNVTCVNGTAHMSFYNYSVTAGNCTSNLLTDFYVKNDLNIAATLNSNGKKIYLGGNWLSGGTFTYANSSLELNGSGNQYILNPGNVRSLYNLAINKASGKAYVNTMLNVYNKLTLTKGVLTTKSSGSITVHDNAVQEGGSDSSYVAGPLKKTGNDAFTFALGDTTLADTSAYHPFSITAPSAASDAFTAQYYAKNQLTDHPSFTSIPSALKNISTCEYWALTRNTGSSTVLPTVSWNGNGCNISILSEMRVAGWDGSQWKNMGQNTLTGDVHQGTISAVSPGINLSNQYYTTANIPHAFIIDTRGVDSLVIPDTLKFTVGGAGLSGTYIAGGQQTVYPDLPTRGTTIPITILFVVAGQSVQVGIEMTSNGTAINPHIIPDPSIPNEPVCNTSGCIEVGSDMTVKDCFLKNCFKLSTTVYAVLRRKLDGGYFTITNGEFRFRFDEEYNDHDGKLSYRLYNGSHKLILNTNTLPASSQKNSNYGTNYYSINLMGCYDDGPFLSGYYTIEVENEKKEVWLMRLKNVIVGPPPACPNNDPGGINQ